MFYAAINSYANETNIGFANTWSVLAFACREDRDDYLAERTDMASRAIKRAEIKNYMSRSVSPFSGARYMIGMTPNQFSGDDSIPGLIGEVYIGYPDDAQAIRALNQ